MSSINVKHLNLIEAFLVSVSIFGLLLSIFFVFYTSIIADGFAYRNLVVGSAFGAVCVLGIYAALFPSSCFTIPKFHKSNKNDKRALNIHETALRAHHPFCENYATHILSIGSMKFCATCSGLLVGAILALLGTGLYFFGSLSIGNPAILVLTGAVGVTLGLLQAALPKSSVGLTRFFASILFVFGTFLMLVSIDMSVKNTFIALFFVGLSILWILTKISLSQRDHRSTCSNCSLKSCIRKKKKS